MIPVDPFPLPERIFKRVINPLKTEVPMIGYYDSGWF